MILKNATLITMDKKYQILENYDLEIKDDKIVNIAPNIDGENIADCTNKIIIPGLINTHAHLPMSIFRSLGEDLNDRLTRYVFPIEAKFINKKNVQTATAFTLLETIRSGTTTIADMYYYDLEIADVLKKASVRAVVGETIINNGGDTFNKNLGQFRYQEDLYNKYHDDELITVAIAPHAPYSNDLDNLIKCRDYSLENNILLMIHSSEMIFEQGEFRGSRSVTQYLADNDLLHSNVILAHSIHVDEDDIKLIKEHGCSVAHNPVSNAKGGRKIMKLKEMHEHNINVGLATDGAMSGNLMDMQSVMYFANKIQKVHYQDREYLTAFDVFKMATIEGAKVLHLDEKVGSLEVNKHADIVIIDPNDCNMLPIYDYYSSLVNAFRPHNVETVIVNGKIIYANNDYKTLDKTQVMKEFNTLVTEIKQHFND